MNKNIYRSISDGREFEVPNDYFRSLHALRVECNSYTQAETRYTELLAEHDKQIKAELLDKVADKIKAKINAVFDEPNYQHNGETWQNGLVMSSDIVDEVIAELKSEVR